MEAPNCICISPNSLQINSPAHAHLNKPYHHSWSCLITHHEHRWQSNLVSGYLVPKQPIFDLLAMFLASILCRWQTTWTPADPFAITPTSLATANFVCLSWNAYPCPSSTGLCIKHMPFRMTDSNSRIRIPDSGKRIHDWGIGIPPVYARACAHFLKGSPPVSEQWLHSTVISMR